ncbi:MAG: hypothetical protein LRZ85_09625 [Alphaproteobacteria bacterium]|nr:hypothetical protein [Alphaproteobacteria bacterium]MCD8526576.1 hypothetical protein [Alphaproteobacteria bacterium]MCD8570310.1 hypothetical protein [Alphaproteobacteria bacterium]
MDNNFADVLALLKAKIPGKTLPQMEEGHVGTLYLAHASSPYYVLPSKALEDKVVILNLWTVKNIGTKESPGLHLEPHEAFDPIRIECEPDSNTVRIFQDIRGGEELLLGKFEMSHPDTSHKIMQIISNRVAAKRFTLARNLQAASNKPTGIIDAGTNPEKDSLMYRKQVIDTIIQYITFAFPTRETVKMETGKHPDAEATKFIYRERGGFRATPALRGCTLEITMNPRTGDRQMAVLKRLGDTGKEQMLFSVAHGATFIDPKTGESSYAELKKIASKLPVQARLDPDFAVEP